MTDKDDFIKALQDEFNDMLQAAEVEAMKELADRERERIREEVKERISGRTPDEIAEEALFEALVAQKGIEATVEAVTEVHNGHKEYGDYLHKHIHSHDQIVTNLVMSFVAELVARLTGEQDLTSQEIATFLDGIADEMDSREIKENRDGGIYAANAFVEYLRERREGTSRFQA